ncbi:MAG: hypothetical protein CL570_00430, partial [Alphaproteobacteria bacterium]|nr:hypothetical protein [Alphaproteobacteria bacterium]
MWTFEPLTETTFPVPTNLNPTVQYRVTNQSNKPHTLTMKPIQGVTQITTGANVCGNPFVLQGKGSCILSLQVNGSELNNPVTNAPVVCQQGSNTQCYRPSSANVLRLTQAEALTLTAIDPASGTQSGGTGFTLTGTSFTSATGVTFGGVAATSINVVNSTTVTGVTPARALSGVVDVVIELPAGSATLANGYTYE